VFNVSACQLEICFCVEQSNSYS